MVAALAAEDSVEVASAALAEAASEEVRAPEDLVVHVQEDSVVRITIILIITVPISVGDGTVRIITAEAADVSVR